jgi:hypothetical protein
MTNDNKVFLFLFQSIFHAIFSNDRWKPPYVAEDGHFEIGDIHEKGLYNDPDEFHCDMDARLLKRSHSTGDLVMRRGRMSTRTEEPR